MKICDEEKSFCFLVSDTARLLRKVFDRKVKSLGLTRAQWSVIVQLCRKDGLSQNELAELLEIEQPSLVKLLDKLEESALVERRQDPKDRRAKHVFLTAKSAEVLEPMQSISQEIRQNMLNGLSEAEQELLLAQLSKIKSNLLDLDN